jgi:hypothetical protein
MYLKFYREGRLIIYTDETSVCNTVTKQAPIYTETEYSKILLTQLLKVNGLVFMKKARTYSFQCPSCVQSEILKTVTTGIQKHN